MSASPWLAQTAPFSPLGAAASVLRGAVEHLRQWRARIRQRADLAELDDRLLRDVGLTRHDVLRETGKPPWRR